MIKILTMIIFILLIRCNKFILQSTTYSSSQIKRVAQREDHRPTAHSPSKVAAANEVAGGVEERSSPVATRFSSEEGCAAAEKGRGAAPGGGRRGTCRRT
jgi:hypothetical protein